MQDMRAELERVRREAAELKATEAAVQATMCREEEEQRRREKARGEHELMQQRGQEREEMKSYCATLQQQRRKVELGQRQAFLEHKRELKAAANIQEQEEIHEAYLEHKEAAEYNAELVKQKCAEEQWLPIEANIERYTTLAAARDEEKRHEVQEQQEERARRERAEMELLLLQAQQEREAALQSLDHVRFHEQKFTVADQSSMPEPTGISSHEY